MVSPFAQLPLETNSQQDPLHRHVKKDVVIVQPARHRLEGIIIARIVYKPEHHKAHRGQHILISVLQELPREGAHL